MCRVPPKCEELIRPEGETCIPYLEVGCAQFPCVAVSPNVTTPDMKAEGGGVEVKAEGGGVDLSAMLQHFGDSKYSRSYPNDDLKNF